MAASADFRPYKTLLIIAVMTAMPNSGSMWQLSFLLEVCIQDVTVIINAILTVFLEMTQACVMVAGALIMWPPSTSWAYVILHFDIKHYMASY